VFFSLTADDFIDWISAARSSHLSSSSCFPLS
jgi:hypothetical protein